ncbi:hypothetical protein JZ751_025855 [Albula glossodonta]|uniref:Ig-like domain-containing protein n=1 Tax=Albula glossodonta TaxID=121402 RepID=A0A8T2NHM3_9TELE|nr:hypothetical protein JZ751_025855 [Albula glossodonta]
MDCTFDINRSNYNWFYWYRQYPGSAPQYILCRGSGSGTADFAKDRFESTADENSGKTVLTIKKLIPEDSAMYYCALRTSAHSGYRAEDTVTQLREDITGFVGESDTELKTQLLS